MKKISVFNFCILIQFCAFSQKIADPSAYYKTIIADDLKKHLSVIASAKMEGRNTPSPGLEKAADYIAGEFKKNGLLPGNNDSYRQTFQLFTNSENISLNINGKIFNTAADISSSILAMKNINLQFEDYVFVGYGLVDSIRNDYKDINVKGKLVVLVNGTPTGFTSSQKASPGSILNKIKMAREKGASGVLVMRKDIPASMKMSKTYRPKSKDLNKEDTSFAVFSISEKVVQSLFGHSIEDVLTTLTKGEAKLGLRKSNIHLKYQINEEVANVSNIVGIIPGTDKKDEYLFITAHYDHLGMNKEGNIYYGADDDGSGTVSVIEMAKAFSKAKKEGKGPRRTIVFMTVCGEEKGLWGSEYYTDNPIFPLEKTTADLNIDMIGRTSKLYLKDKDSTNYVYVVGDDKLSTDLTPITEEINKKHLGLKLDRMYNDPKDPEQIYYRSDHYNFARKGVPIIFYFDGMVEGDYHQITDTVDKINFSLLSRRAQLVFCTAWEMANRNDMLKRDLKLPE